MTGHRDQVGYWPRAIAALVVSAAFASATFAQDAAAPTSRRHALLIGCTAYPNLSESLQLTGPANDVALTTTLLKERFGFADAEIVTLLHEHEPQRRPTAGAIAREFGRLAEAARPGDIVFILLAGHGSQLANDNPDDPADVERDGLDEVFLPEDVAEWSLAQPAVGAIRDDQLGQWLDAIRAKGATAFFVADTCHSGTMDRGAPVANSRVRARYVDPKLLNPPEALEQAPDKQADAESAGVADTAADSRASAFHDEVLGRQSWRERSTVTLRRGEFGELSLDVGHLHGATLGSIYKVYPPAGAEGDDAPAGCVVVTELTPTTARVETCAFDDVAETPYDALPAPGRCELAFAAAGSLKLAVGVGVALFDPPAATVELHVVEQLVDELAAQPNALVHRAPDGHAPDAFVLVGSRGLYLRRAVDAAVATNADGAEFPIDAFGPFAADSRPSSKLDKALDAMAKAINIRRLAESGELMVIGDPNAPVVELQTRVERRNATTGEFEPVDASRPLDAHDGDQLRVTVTNDSTQAVDVTVLYIDSAYSIVSYLPTAYQTSTGAANNRLGPGQSAPVTFKINASTLGLEDVIIIATLTMPATPMQNFAFLAQPGIERGVGPAHATPLGQLLAAAAFGGDRGGAAAPDMARYAVHRVSWTVREGAAPKP
jgi:hypothetical protein